jgi:hypothetical protein
MATTAQHTMRRTQCMTTSVTRPPRAVHGKLLRTRAIQSLMHHLILLYAKWWAARILGRWQEGSTSCRAHSRLGCGSDSEPPCFLCETVKNYGFDRFGQLHARGRRRCASPQVSCSAHSSTFFSRLSSARYGLHRNSKRHSPSADLERVMLAQAVS